MSDLMWLFVVYSISLWCDLLHKKHHQLAPEIGDRAHWCCKCLAYYEPLRDSNEV